LQGVGLVGQLARLAQRDQGLLQEHGQGGGEQEAAGLGGGDGVKRLAAVVLDQPVDGVAESGRLGQEGRALLQIKERLRGPRKYSVYLTGQYEVVLMQALNLLGLERDSRVAPSKTDIRMVAFGFCEFTNLLDKAKRLPEILESEIPLDPTSIVHQLPVWGLSVE